MYVYVIISMRESWPKTEIILTTPPPLDRVSLCVCNVYLYVYMYITYTSIYTYIHVRTYIYSYIHTIHTYIHTCIYRKNETHLKEATGSDGLKYKYIHTYIHTYIHKHICI